jgi:hypothetical protein
MFKKTLSWHKMDKNTIPLTILIEEYITTCRLEGKAPKTIRGYREKLLRFTRAVGGTLANFNPPTVRAYIGSLQKARKFEGHPWHLVKDEFVSTMTVRNYVRALPAWMLGAARDARLRGGLTIRPKGS